MTSVACRECQREVSRSARKCPHCRAPNPGQPHWQGTGREWKSKTTIWGYPLIHIAYGRNAQGKLRVAKGVIAIGQFAIGLIAIAQFGVGLLFGFGQFVCALSAFAQVALTPTIGIGQLATGYIALGQIALGYYALGYHALGIYSWGVNHRDIEALIFFARFLPFLRAPE
ncbi:MAG: hypothetical protein ETSY1_21780 [Candidatus Entotheonella factor]|uniref:Zinc ribbon domain-containing protein n=1 Tax=Entotheonella factor TaxID=1429438 RepID=W4LIA3_ENTF1|nr:hypothetical protein [Candidatus Entotheonella palauensis]ETW97649.1 MAG: hypothetical protein ETSY1_21780 [Candidatus Entotheonella factor]